MDAVRKNLKRYERVRKKHTHMVFLFCVRFWANLGKRYARADCNHTIYFMQPNVKPENMTQSPCAPQIDQKGTLKGKSTVMR